MPRFHPGLVAGPIWQRCKSGVNMIVKVRAFLW